jgi:hypothetical protein
VQETYLDLTVPENRRAFEQVFEVDGPFARPRPRAVTTERERLDALGRRLDADGLVALFDYDVRATTVGANAGGNPTTPPSRQSMVFGQDAGTRRDLRDARYLDRRGDMSRFLPLPSCTEPTAGVAASSDLARAACRAACTAPDVSR